MMGEVVVETHVSLDVEHLEMPFSLSVGKLQAIGFLNCPYMQGEDSIIAGFIWESQA